MRNYLIPGGFSGTMQALYMRRLIMRKLLAVFSLVLAPLSAAAVPTLQLDIAGGSYDSVSETIVTSDDAFTVYAYATPQGRTLTSSLTGRTHYLSIALTPKTGPDDVAAGSFTVNGTPYHATQDMTYGVPPVEESGLAGHDGGDLGGHDVYSTYFLEIPFQFTSAQRSGAYDTQEDPGQGPIAGDDMMYVSFEIDRSGLPAGYELHFDLYSIRRTRTGDLDVNAFAPFSHDAATISRTPPVPEPTAALIFAAGLLAARSIRPR
jgi:hypothetical protein